VRLGFTTESVKQAQDYELPDMKKDRNMLIPDSGPIYHQLHAQHESLKAVVREQKLHLWKLRNELAVKKSELVSITDETGKQPLYDYHMQESVDVFADLILRLRKGCKAEHEIDRLSLIRQQIFKLQWNRDVSSTLKFIQSFASDLSPDQSRYVQSARSISPIRHWTP
jgi:hypothetical protein